MNIEIIKGSENPVAEFLSSPSNTPETDAAIKAAGGEWSYYLGKCSRKLERERDELRRMSVIEMMGENINVKHHVTEWENRCIKAEQERDEAREENAKLRDIAERAIDAVFHKTTEDILRAELNQLMEGAK
jgi:hypothetical protein